jgi:hypothetical protein
MRSLLGRLLLRRGSLLPRARFWRVYSLLPSVLSHRLLVHAKILEQGILALVQLHVAFSFPCYS